ncbi:MAG: aminotransferase class I/II-fold pyridoxal phosphate-dependent enzyme [Oscillospiraceae bacterium]
MALDGMFLNTIVKEIKSAALNSRVEKISQPSREEVVISLRCRGENGSKNESKKLLISANASAPRLHFTTISLENPASPPMFCMLLRKHLNTARLIDVTQNSLDRTINLVFEAVDELGDLTTAKIIIEIMGRHSNVILVNSAGKVVDSLKRITNELSSVRMILPGITYELPPSQNKINLLTCDINEILNKIISLDLNDILKDFSLPLNRYPDPYAVELCKAFGDFYNVDYKNVTAGNGSDELISLIIGAFFTQKDKIVTLDPDFSMYKFYGSIFGIETLIDEKNGNLMIDVDELIEKINHKNIDGLIFSNPCNPTSICINRQDVLKLVENVDALVIVDEAYMDFSDQSILDVYEKYDNLIVLKTCSKAIGLAGIRLGFAVSNQKITQALKAVKSPYNVNAITQKVGECVLKDKKYLENCVADIVKNRNYLYYKICELQKEYDIIEKVYETSTNFVFIKTKQSEHIFKKLLKDSIAIRFMGDYLRINTGSEQENDVLLSCLEKMLKKM